MVKCKRKRKKHTHKKHTHKKHGAGSWLLVVFAMLGVLLIIDFMPWRKLCSMISSQWSQHDKSKDSYSKNFDGIDISRHQGSIRWDELVDENPQLRFVYIKATEGSSVVDPFYNKNFKAAKKRGLLVGSYHFLTYRTSMERQVDNFLANIDLSQQDLLLLIDIEESGTGKWKRSTIQENLAEFIRLIKKRTGVSPMIYTNESYYRKNLYPEFNHYRLFIANYNYKPRLQGVKCDIWQSSERGRVHGISTRVDIDRLRDGVSIDDIMMPE